MTQDAAIRSNVECIGCCYNLRGLTSEGRCPECGMRIIRSILLADRKFAFPVCMRVFLNSIRTFYLVPFAAILAMVDQGVTLLLLLLAGSTLRMVGARRLCKAMYSYGDDRLRGLAAHLRIAAWIEVAVAIAAVSATIMTISFVLVQLPSSPEAQYVVLIAMWTIWLIALLYTLIRLGRFVEIVSRMFDVELVVRAMRHARWFVCTAIALFYVAFAVHVARQFDITAMTVILAILAAAASLLALITIWYGCEQLMELAELRQE